MKYHAKGSPWKPGYSYNSRVYYELVDDCVWLGPYVNDTLTKYEDDELFLMALNLPCFFVEEGEVSDEEFEAMLTEYEALFAKNGVKVYRDPSFSVHNERYVFAFMTKAEIYSFVVEDGKRLIISFATYYDYDPGLKETTVE